MDETPQQKNHFRINNEPHSETDYQNATPLNAQKSTNVSFEEKQDLESTLLGSTLETFNNFASTTAKEAQRYRELEQKNKKLKTENAELHMLLEGAQQALQVALENDIVESKETNASPLCKQNEITDENRCGLCGSFFVDDVNGALETRSVRKLLLAVQTENLILKQKLIELDNKNENNIRTQKEELLNAHVSIEKEKLSFLREKEQLKEATEKFETAMKAIKVEWETLKHEREAIVKERESLKNDKDSLNEIETMNETIKIEKETKKTDVDTQTESEVKNDQNSQKTENEHIRDLQESREELIKVRQTVKELETALIEQKEKVKNERHKVLLLEQEKIDFERQQAKVKLSQRESNSLVFRPRAKDILREMGDWIDAMEKTTKKETEKMRSSFGEERQILLRKFHEKQKAMKKSKEL